jgi:integration host factor alpha subunit
MALTKAEMAERLYEDVGLNKREAKEFVDAFFDALREALEQGRQIKLSGFGNFDLRRKNQRPGRNPKTGQQIPISARTVVTFRPGPEAEGTRRGVQRRQPAWGRRMLDPGSNRELPPIPAKRYFTIGEVSELCDVKPHVLRYWETEFPSLEPAKRRGNRRYYQRHDVLMVRQIRSLLYEQGYTIGGARLRLEGEGAKQESALSNQIAKQVRMELEEVLQLLRR